MSNINILGTPTLYDRFCLKLSQAEVDAKLQANTSFTIRFKIPNMSKLIVGVCDSGAVNLYQSFLFIVNSTNLKPDIYTNAGKKAVVEEAAVFFLKKGSCEKKSSHGNLNLKHFYVIDAYQ